MKKRFKVVGIVVNVLFILFYAFGLIHSDLGNNYELKFLSDLNFNEGWKTLDGKEVNISEIAYVKDYTLTKQLPDNIEEAVSLNFFSVNMRYKIFVDGSIVKDYKPYSGKYWKEGTGRTFNYVAIDTSTSSREIKIVGDPVYKGEDCFIAYMELDVASSYIHNMNGRFWFSFAITIMIMVLGLIMLVLHYALNIVDETMNLAFLGMSAIMLGGWCCFRTMIPLLLTSKSLVFYNLGFIFLLFIPAPAMSFAVSVTERKREEYKYVIALTTILTASIIGFEMLSGHGNPYRILRYIHLNLFVQMLVLVVMSIDEYRYIKKNSIKLKRDLNDHVTQVKS